MNNPVLARAMKIAAAVAVAPRNRARGKHELFSAFENMGLAATAAMPGLPRAIKNAILATGELSRAAMETVQPAMRGPAPVVPLRRGRAFTGPAPAPGA